MSKKYKAKIDGEFVEITWKHGNDKKVLLIKPVDIVKNHTAQQEREHIEPPRSFTLIDGEFVEVPAGEAQGG